MTNYPFVPSSVSAPQFQPTLDGQQYLVQLFWSLFGQRYYVQCSTIQGVLIFNVPLVESPGGVTVQSLAWNDETGNAQGTTSVPHGYKLGATVALTVSGASPVGYNGQQLVLITGPSSFTYPMVVTSDPGPATVGGVLSYDINIAGGYFASTLVFRNSAFTVTP